MALTYQKVIISGNDLEFYTYPHPIMYGVSVPHVVRRKKQTGHIITERSLYATKSRLRRLLQANAFQYKDSENKVYAPIFITFTFAEAITDLTQAQRFFTKFVRVLTTKEFKQDSKFLKYLGVPEIQKKREQAYGVGVWHFHVVFFNLPFMTKVYDKIFAYWGQGFTLVETVKSTSQLVKYLSKYLTKNNSDERLFGRKKYFTSKGLFRPSVIRDTEVVDAVRNLVGDKQPDYTMPFLSPKFNNEPIIYEKYQLSDFPEVYKWLADKL